MADQSNSLTLEDFMKMVEQMRSAQNEYFCVRAPSCLARSKKLEKEIDGIIRAWKTKEMLKQKGLFN